VERAGTITFQATILPLFVSKLVWQLSIDETLANGLTTRYSLFALTKQEVNVKGAFVVTRAFLGLVGR
jgi:hypothetical protein